MGPFGLPSLAMERCQTLPFVLHWSDGMVVSWGQTAMGECNASALPGGLTCTLLAAGGGHTVPLRSDDTAVVCGQNPDGQFSITVLFGGLTHTRVAAGCNRTVLLRRDGSAVACVWHATGDCTIPASHGDLTHTRAGARVGHTVVLGAMARPWLVGRMPAEKCNIASYTYVSAGWLHTELSRSDGTTVAGGKESTRTVQHPSVG